MVLKARLARVAMGMACLGWASAAHAQDAPAVPTEPRWYGRTSLILDAVGLGLEGLGVVVATMEPKSDSMGFGPMGVLFGSGIMFFGAPLVHLDHGHGWRALGSLLIRSYGIAAFTYGAVWLVRGGQTPETPQDYPAGGVFFVAGQLGFGFVDDVFWSRDERAVAVTSPQSVRRAPLWRPALPTLTPTPNGATLGWGGSF